MSCRPWLQVGPRDSHEAVEAIRFRGADSLTQPGEPVVAATLILVWSSPMSELLGESVVHEALQGSVQGRRTHPYQPARRRLDVLHDRVAVPLSCGERYEHVELGLRQRKVRVRISHPSSLHRIAIYCQAIDRRPTVRSRSGSLGAPVTQLLTHVPVGTAPDLPLGAR